jgi:predicted nucleic acid-binding protein
MPDVGLDEDFARAPVACPSQRQSVSGWLLDADVLSEARRSAGVRTPGRRRSWQPRTHWTAICRVQVLGEIRRGVERIRRRGDTMQAHLLEDWLLQLAADYANRILDFDHDCAEAWGALMAADPGHPVDAQIAAIAGLHGLTVVTRNTSDFAATGVATHNPFS